MEAIARLLYHVFTALDKRRFFTLWTGMHRLRIPHLCGMIKAEIRLLIPPRGGPLSGVLPDSDLFGLLVSSC